MGFIHKYCFTDKGYNHSWNETDEYHIELSSFIPGMFIAEKSQFENVLSYHSC